MHHAPHAILRGGARVDRVALLSVHTCPLDQPGVGDAGGMNVYLREVARRLGEMGVAVDVFTRDAGCPGQVVSIGENARVVHVEAGPRAPIAKEDVPETLGQFLVGVHAFVESDTERKPAYDLVHAHYWMSGRVGRILGEKWRVPFLQTFHTLAKVKNLTLAPGDTPEPKHRIASETRIVTAADGILAPTVAEADELAGFYGATPDRVRVVSPGVDTDVFRPGPAHPDALGWPKDRPVVLFVGRLQPLKSPEVAVRAFAEVANGRAGPDRPLLVVVGGPSGTSGTDIDRLRMEAGRLGLRDDDIVWSPPLTHPDLAKAYRSAAVTVVPSRTESFGLVALESQACGTPVVASDVGGLRTAVRDGETGLSIPVGDVAGFADAIRRILDEPGLRAELSQRAVGFARRFDWRWVARGLLGAYEDAVAAGARSSREPIERDA